MLTTTHAYATWRLSAESAHPGWRTFGAVLPDLPLWVVGGLAACRGASPRTAVGRALEQPLVGELALLLHGVPGWAVVGACSKPGGRLRALSHGWIGHLVVDYLSHRDDPWPALWPLSLRRWRGPVSYWQREHHAELWTAAEVAWLLRTAVRDRSGVALASAAIAVGARWGWSRSER